VKVAIFSTTLAIFSQKHLRQAPESEGADQGYQAKQVPTVPVETQDAETVRQCGEGHQEEERTGEVTVHASTAERIRNTRHAHCGQRDDPNGCSPTSADGKGAGHDNR
jgi:hypothetical protein